MSPIYGCPDCGKELRQLDDGDYKCKSCKEEFDWHYIESYFGGGDVLQYGMPLFEDEDEEFQGDEID